MHKVTLQELNELAAWWFYCPECAATIEIHEHDLATSEPGKGDTFTCEFCGDDIELV